MTVQFVKIEDHFFITGSGSDFVQYSKFTSHNLTFGMGEDHEKLALGNMAGLSEHSCQGSRKDLDSR